MIHYLYGENSFAIERELAKLVSNFANVPEKIDGERLELRDLPDVFAGQTLFASERLVVIRGLADNKPVWGELENYLNRVSDDIMIVLIDAKPDKRTRTYKVLQKVATMHEAKIMSDREARVWVGGFAKQEFGLRLDSSRANLIVDRAGSDQWALYHALQKLSVFDEITTELITEIIDASPQENVFLLLDSALRGNQEKVGQVIRALEATEDGFRTFGLLSSQVVSLIALSLAGPNDNVAKDFGASPFALQKLRGFAEHLTPARRRRIMTIFAAADSELKLGVEPWLVITKSLVKLS